jgi:hypothetical protein
MKNLILIALGTLVSVSALADRPYGVAGCGLGNLVVGKGGSQILASTTNDTSYSQMFGISSGTSNCTDAGMVANRRQLPLFIEANRSALAKDMARGQGETLQHVAHAFGCSDKEQFNSTMQKNFGSVFASQNSDGMAINNAIVDVIKDDKNLSGSCRI